MVAKITFLTTLVLLLAGVLAAPAPDRAEKEDLAASDLPAEKGDLQTAASHWGGGHWGGVGYGGYGGYGGHYGYPGYYGGYGYGWPSYGGYGYGWPYGGYGGYGGYYGNHGYWW